MKWSARRLPNSALALQKKSEKATPRKRKFGSEVGSERRNPSRKARPRDNFAVEEKSEPRPCKTPKNVDVETLLKVRVWDPHPAPALTDMGLMKGRPQLFPMFWLWTIISAVSHSTYMYFLARRSWFSLSSMLDRAGGQTGAEEEEEPQCQEKPVWREVSWWDYRRRPGKHSVPQQRQDLGQGEGASHQAHAGLAVAGICPSRFATVPVCSVSAGQLMSPMQTEDSGH